VKLKKYDEARRGFEAALKLDPPDWVQRDYALFLATCPDAKYRDGKRAVELAHKAIELAGKDTDWRFYAALAAAHAEAGEFDSAVADQRQALEDKSLDAEDRKALERRLELYRMEKPYRDGE
jgi:tetratricopeptide (TPR) repeat protein